MDTLELRLVIALILSAAIGLERQSYIEHKDRDKLFHHGVIGVRTHIMIGILGIVSGLLLQIAPLLSMFVGIGFGVLMTLYYIHESHTTKDYGPTSELNMIWCYCMSALLSSGLVLTQIVVSLAVVALFVMSTKEKIHSLIDAIHWRHVQQMILFGIITLVVLPYLPSDPLRIGDIPYLVSVLKAFQVPIDGSIVRLEILNLYSVWRVVVIMTGLDIVVFFLQHLMGKKQGWIVASILGGLVSSTSTTVALASAYKRHHQLIRTVVGIIIANVASFVPMLVIFASTNTLFMTATLPLLIGLMCGGILLVLYFLIRYPTDTESQLDEKSKNEIQDIFTLKPALTFAVIFAMVKMVTKLSYALLGDAGYLAGSAIAGMSGMDAVAINAAQLAGDTISFNLALTSLIAANTVNFVTKTLYAWTSGDRRLAVWVGSSLIAMTVCMLIGWYLAPGM